MNENNETSDMHIGQKMDNGSIYLGISDTTQTDMHTMSATIRLNWNKAIALPTNIQDEIHGHKGSAQRILPYLPKSENYPYGTELLTEEAKKLPLQFLQDPTQDDGGWRLPTTEEWKQIYNNKALLGFLNNFIQENNLSHDFWWTCEQILPETPRPDHAEPYAHFAGWGQGMIMEANLFDLVTGETHFEHKGKEHNVLLVRTEPRSVSVPVAELK